MGNRRWMGKNPAVCVRMPVRRLLMSFVLFVVLTEKEGPSILQRSLSADCNRAARSVECANQICLSPSQKSVRKYFAEALFSFFLPLACLSRKQIWEFRHCTRRERCYSGNMKPVFANRIIALLNIVLLDI